jgi:hypothetical protein
MVGAVLMGSVLVEAVLAGAVSDGARRAGRLLWGALAHLLGVLALSGRALVLLVSVLAAVCVGARPTMRSTHRWTLMVIACLRNGRVVPLPRPLMVRPLLPA